MKNKDKMLDLAYEMFLSGCSKKQIALLLGTTKIEVKKELHKRTKNMKKDNVLFRKMPIISFN